LSKAKRRGVEIRDYFSQIDGYEEKVLAAGNLSKDDLIALFNKNADVIRGKEFYHAVKDAGADLNAACSEIFIKLPQPNFKKQIGTDPNKTRLENFVEQFIVLRQDIAAKIGTDPSTFSRFLNGDREILAHQVYFLARAHSIEPETAFEFLYGPKGIGKT